MIYFVVLATIAWLPLTALSFSFTSEPEQPLVVVLYSNSTDVDFRWEFSLANGDIFSNIHVKRFQKDQGLASLVILGYYQARYKNVNTSLYNLDPNVSNGPSSGYVNFTIKDITKQLNNKDGSKADAQSIDYVYRLVVKIANILEPQVSSVETSVLLKVHNFEGPKNVNTTESEQFNVACSADGKPSPNLMLALPNGVEIKGTGSIDVNLTAYRNMTGMFNCTAENIVSVPQTKSAWLNVWYSASCTILPAIASEGDTVTLNISTTGNPGVINYNCTHPNGSVLTGKPPTFKVQRPDDGLYNCSVFNGIGERGYCTGKVTVHYTPKAKMTCPLSVCVNQTIDITCEADASPDNITYSLSYGTSVLNHAVNGHVSHNVRESGDQKFSCNASNTIGQGATVYCTVKVYEPPEIKDCWINGKATSKGNVVNGTGVSLTCNIAGSYNLSSARWTKDDREWKGVNITFLALHPHTTGTYYLTVYSGLECNKTVKANLSLTVTFPASCAFPQDVIQVTEGDNVILNVSSTGSPPVNEYIWTHPNGSRLTGNSILRFIASRQDTGTYHCSVYNGIGERGNCTRYVNVTYSAECEIYPNTPTVTVNESDLVDLTCKTNGNPEANDYIWNYPNGSSLPGSSVLSFIASRKDSTSYHCSVSNGVGDRGNCSRQVTVQSFENIKVIGSSNKSYSPSHPEVWFNVSVTAYPNDISLSCETSTSGIFTIISIYNTGLNVKTYIVFVIIKTGVDSASIECVAKRGAIKRRTTTLFVYKQPTIFKEKITGRFEITNHEWQDDLNNSDSAAYNNLKIKCMKILEKAYDNIPYVVGKDIRKFVKGSVIVVFQLEIIKQISDPLLPLKILTNKSRGEIDGIKIDIKSIIESKDVTHDCKIEDKPLGNETNNAVLPFLGALLALSVLVIILLIVGYFRLYRKGSNDKLPKRSNNHTEHSHVNEIALQESRFNRTENVSTNNAAEHEAINAGIPEYEAVETRTRQAYYPSNTTDDQDNQIQTRNQEGQLPTNTPPIYQETREQPHTYGSLSPFTKLPPKNTLSSSPNQDGEYQSLQQRGVTTHYQSLDDLGRC